MSVLLLRDSYAKKKIFLFIIIYTNIYKCKKNTLLQHHDDNNNYIYLCVDITCIRIYVKRCILNKVLCCFERDTYLMYVT